MGTFNLNLFKSDSNSDIAEFENFFMSEGLYPAISLATHVSVHHHMKGLVSTIFSQMILKMYVSLE